MSDRDLVEQLKFFSEIGVSHLQLPETPEETGSPATEPSRPEKATVEAAPGSSGAAQGSPSASEDDEFSRPVVFPEGPLALNQVRAILGECRRCPLSESRNQIVFGVGDPEADLMFVGEAPGEDEDALGLAFVGRAGQLLSRIVRAIGLYRDQVYVANILKCRPPNNRDPLPHEVDACSPFLAKQVEAVRPLVLVALGRYAAQTLLNTTTGIKALRGNFHEYRGVPLMPTYHPSYLLRSPAGKRDVWEDMKAVRAKLEELGSRYYR